MQLAGLSLDLDDLWTYRRSFGHPDWRQHPTFLDVAIPRWLSLYAKLGVSATAFVVGHDATLERNLPLLRSLVEAGLEIGNHSHWHDHRLQQQHAAAIDQELAAAETAISNATGVKPSGFRGPAFATSPALIRCLMARGYRYDASSFPTSIGPLARRYQRRQSRQTTGQLSPESDDLYGGFSAAREPQRPFCWHDGDARLIEIPVTTMPLTRLPIHMTYIHFLADRSPSVARGYFRLALRLCRQTGLMPSLLLHATDFIGADDPFVLDGIPGMGRNADDKVALTRELLLHCRSEHRLTGLGEFVAALDPATLPVRPLDAERSR